MFVSCTDLSEDALLYVSAAKGFRAGGANADQSFGTDPDYVQAFDPDESWAPTGDSLGHVEEGEDEVAAEADEAAEEGSPAGAAD